MDMILTGWSTPLMDLTLGKTYRRMENGTFLDDVGDVRLWYRGTWKEPVASNQEFTFGQRMTLVGFTNNEFYYVGTHDNGVVFFTREPIPKGRDFSAESHGSEEGMNDFIPYVEPEVEPTEYTVEELEAKLGEKIKVVSK